jgi:hypothetical protein
MTSRLWNHEVQRRSDPALDVSPDKAYEYENLAGCAAVVRAPRAAVGAGHGSDLNFAKEKPGTQPGSTWRPGFQAAR